MRNSTISSNQILDALTKIREGEYFVGYVFSILASVVIIRLFISLLKAKSVSNERNFYYINSSYGELFLSFFLSHKRDKDISDCWLPIIIGLFELTAFPILIHPLT